MLEACCIKLRWLCGSVDLSRPAQMSSVAGTTLSWKGSLRHLCPRYSCTAMLPRKNSEPWQHGQGELHHSPWLQRREAHSCCGSLDPLQVPPSYPLAWVCKREFNFLTSELEVNTAFPPGHHHYLAQYFASNYILLPFRFKSFRYCQGSRSFGNFLFIRTKQIHKPHAWQIGIIELHICRKIRFWFACHCNLPDFNRVFFISVQQP